MRIMILSRFQFILIVFGLSQCFGLCDLSGCNLSGYDHLAFLNNTVFLLSARPCSKDQLVVLTVMQVNGRFHHLNFTANTQLAPIRIYANQSVGVVIDCHLHEHNVISHIKHITIKHVVLNDNNTVKNVLPNNVLDVMFEFNHEKCQEFIKGDKAVHEGGFQKQQNCALSVRHGDFSTLCFVKSKGIFITVMDICDIPYSLKVVSVTSDKSSYKEILFTTENSGELIPISGKESSSGCGVSLTMFHSHMIDHKKQHVLLEYKCKTPHKGDNITLIDDSYLTIYGLLCKKSKCGLKNVNHRLCSVQVIGKDGVSASTSVDYKLDVCEKKADVKISIKGYNKSIDATVNVVPYFEEETSKRLEPYNLLTPGSNPRFLSLNTGELSLHLKNDTSHKRFYIMIFLHSPRWSDAIPLIRDQIEMKDTNTNVCKKSSNLTKKKPEKGGLKVWVIVIIAIVGVMVVISLVVIFRWWVKRGNYKDRIGLPYDIELDDDQFSLQNDNDY